MYLIHIFAKMYKRVFKLKRLVVIKRYDAENMTFGERIECGRIFSDEKTDMAQKAKSFLSDVLGIEQPTTLDIKLHSTEIILALEKIIEWGELEKKLLNYTPSSDEVAAGIKRLTEISGPFATIKTLAAKYGQDPDNVLKWKYSKVFHLLYTDLEEFKYNKRLNEIMSSKRK